MRRFRQILDLGKRELGFPEYAELMQQSQSKSGFSDSLWIGIVQIVSEHATRGWIGHEELAEDTGRGFPDLDVIAESEDFEGRGFDGIFAADYGVWGDGGSGWRSVDFS